MENIDVKQENSPKQTFGEMFAGKTLLYVTIFFMCLLISLLMSGCKHKDKDESGGGTPSIEVATPAVGPVTVYATYPGEMASLSEAEVMARVNGQILSKHFQDGATVTKGQLLFTIEPTMYGTSVSEAKAELESARGQLSYAQKHLAALEEGMKANAVSEMDVIQARSAEAEARASVNRCEAALKAASTKLGYCRVTAPISGKISAATYDVGDYVNGDGAPVALATIYNDGDLAVKFSIPDYEYNAIAENGVGFTDSIYENIPLEVSASPTSDDAAAASKARITGHLSYQAPRVDASTGSVNMRVDINPGYQNLKSGMYCKVFLPKRRLTDAILVKDASISTDQRGKYLYTLNDSNKIVYTPIQVGDLYDDTLRLVTSGLKPDSRYVTRAMISVRNGEKVNPKMVKTK